MNKCAHLNATSFVLTWFGSHRPAAVDVCTRLGLGHGHGHGIGLALELRSGLCVGSPGSLRMQWKFFLLSILCTSCQFINHFCLSVCICLCSTWPATWRIRYVFSRSRTHTGTHTPLLSAVLALIMLYNMIYFNHYAKWFFVPHFSFLDFCIKQQ